MSEQLTTQYEMTSKEKRFIGLHLVFAIFALTLGSMFGPLQAFEHAGWDLYPYIKPLFKSYYQGLTLHGVLNALVWTTFFITGFLTLSVTHGLKRPLRFPRLNVVGFWTMVVGLVMAHSAGSVSKSLRWHTVPPVTRRHTYRRQTVACRPSRY